MNFWTTLQAERKAASLPITALAPMEEVTDVVFRSIIQEIGRPDVFYTEFASVEGINSIGRNSVLHRLRREPNQSPVVAQLWGTTTLHYQKAAEIAVDLGFEGLDINMGCPVPKVIKRGACSALIKNPALAKEIVEAARIGLAGRIPLSIKTRLGFGTIQTEEWIGFILQELKPDALTIHLRTVKELSGPEPHWEEMAKIVALRDKYSPQTILLANGNLGSLTEITDRQLDTGMDGGMVGRGIFHNPWLFTGRDPSKITTEEKLQLLIKHTNLFEQTWGPEKNFAVMKRFFKIYTSGFTGASELRQQLMECKTAIEVETIITRFLV